MPRQLIHLAEVEVFSGGTNVARNGKASQSSTGYGGDAARAIDGNTTGEFAANSVSHTGDGDPNPFWEVDLGREFPLEKIVVWNRTDGLEERLAGAKLVVLDGARQIAYSEKISEAPRPKKEFDLSGWTRVELKSASEDTTTEAALRDGKNIRWDVPLEDPHAAVFNLAKPLAGGDGTLLSVTFEQPEKERPMLTRFRITATTKVGLVREVPQPIRAIISTAPADRSTEQKAALADFLRPEAEAYAGLRAEIAGKKSELAGIKAIDVPVMEEKTERPARFTHSCERKFPRAAGGSSARGAGVVQSRARPTMLTGSRWREWLMAPDNPLTARVAVNRFWAQLFGTGIVETEEDFGTQGSQPSNPELLDWLAVTFRTPKAEGGLGWDMKALVKLIVSSETYRQSSVASDAAR